MNESLVTSLSERLDAAIAAVQTTGLLTAEHPDMTLEDGYAVQASGRRARLARGERLVGAKLGLTSLAKQQRMGISEPIFGYLTDAAVLAPGARLDIGSLIHPRVEPEIVFRLGSDLRGPGISREDVLAATATVHAGMEVIDSRYADFKFTIADVVADNTSAARIVVSAEGVDPAGLDLAAIEVSLRRNGAEVHTATGAAVLGDPASAVALLVEHLTASGEFLPAGALVLSGGMTDAVEVGLGDEIEAVFSALGPLRLGAR